MKRKIAFFLALVLLVGILAGCKQDMGMLIREDASGELSAELRISLAGITFLTAQGVDTEAIKAASTLQMIDGRIYRILNRTYAFSNPDQLGRLLDAVRGDENFDENYSADIRTYAEGGYYWLEISSTFKAIEGWDGVNFELTEDMYPEGYDKEEFEKLTEGLRKLVQDEEAQVLITITLPNENYTVSGLADAVTKNGNTLTIDLTKTNVDDSFRLTARLAPVTAPTVSAPVTRQYSGAFTDIPTSGWKYNAIVACYNTGLMSGTSDTTFDPSGNLTLAQAITMAVNLRTLYEGDSVPAKKAGEKWYTPYVTYAEEKGILLAGEFSAEQLTKNCTRAEMAYIFANALPLAEYAAINAGYTIPDMKETDLYFRAVDRLYSAGIAVGGTNHAFLPENTISRAEAAAILSRISTPAQRVKI